MTMNSKNKTKLIASGIALCCCASAAGAVMMLGKHGDISALPASLSTSSEPPVIILDAGHGASG